MDKYRTMTSFKKCRGVLSPMITPFGVNGQIDQEAVKRILDRLLENEIAPFILGTTGECASLSQDLKLTLTEAVVRCCAGRTRVYAGISDNCLSNSVELARRLFDAGVDCVVAHLPSYYPLREDAMLRYYEMLAEKIFGPLMIYNITITTHMSIPLSVIEKLSHHPNIVGMKDSERNNDRLKEAIALFAEREDFSHLTGCGALMGQALCLGSDGLVAGTANVAPELYQRMYQAARNNDQKQVCDIQCEVDQISKIYQENNILSESLAILKAMMNLLGYCEPFVLPPLRTLDEEQIRQLKSRMLQCGCLLQAIQSEGMVS